MGEIKVRATGAAFKSYVPIVEQLTSYSICRGSIGVCINCTAKRKKTDQQKQKTRNRKPDMILNQPKITNPRNYKDSKYQLLTMLLDPRFKDVLVKNESQRARKELLKFIKSI